MTLPDRHPPFATAAAGVPADALPFGRTMCDHLARAFIDAGPAMRDAILELCMRDMAMHCQGADLEIGGGVRLSAWRDIVGPAPLAIRLGARAVMHRMGLGEISYGRGVVSIRCDMPQSVIGALVGRCVRDVIEVPATFPGASARIVRAHDNGYGQLVLGVAHRKTSITYADLAGPLPIAA